MYSIKNNLILKYIFLCLNFFLLRTQEDDFIIIAAERPELIQITYPHFTHFLGMMHLGIKGSSYGFLDDYKEEFFPSLLNFKAYGVMVYFNKSVINKFGDSRWAFTVDLFKNKNLSSYLNHDNLLMYLWSKFPIFENELKKDVIIDDIMASWQLFFLWFITAANYQPPNNAEMPNKLSMHDLISGTYIYHVCSAIRKIGKDDPICPDPCKRRPCASVPNVATELCFQDALGLFINDFTCKCKYGFNWRVSTRSCEPYDMCSTQNICYKQGTSRCVYIPEKMESRCECKISYMGGRCSILRDPCIETSSSTLMSGNMFCNTGQGNQCIGTPGTDKFECICTKSWTQDFSYSLSNCLAFRDLCSKKICQGGDCVSSKDGQTTRCICSSELTGDYCNLKRSIWGRWLPWSTCDPICGPVRRAVRVRFCNGRDCLGERRQVKLCEPTYCGSHPMFEFASPSRWKSNYYQMFAFLFLLGMMNLFICVCATLMLLIVLCPFVADKIAVLIPK